MGVASDGSQEEGVVENEPVMERCQHTASKLGNDVAAPGMNDALDATDEV